MYLTKGDRVTLQAWEVYYALAQHAEESGVEWDPVSLMEQAASEAAEKWAASDGDEIALRSETLRVMLRTTEAP